MFRKISNHSIYNWQSFLCQNLNRNSIILNVEIGGNFCRVNLKAMKKLFCAEKVVFIFWQFYSTIWWWQFKSYKFLQLFRNSRKWKILQKNKDKIPSGKIFPNVLRLHTSLILSVVSARACCIFEGKKRRGEWNVTTGTILMRWRERTHPEPSISPGEESSEGDPWHTERSKEKGN